MNLIHRTGLCVLTILRRLMNPAFGQAMNPVQHLGSLTIYFLWIILISGIWLFIFFDTSVHGAYQSVEYLTHEQWFIGGIMRSLHRYASDAAIITLVLHILKEFSNDRYRNNRWFSWVTGVPLLWLIIPLGFTGYWLVWDRLAQYVALTTGELVDWLPLFTESMARNFLSEFELTDRFFTLMAFLHLLGLPILLVFGIWLHVFRISRPEINPPRRLMAGSLIALLGLSLVYPAYSQGPVNMSLLPETLAIDWYYLQIYPLAEVYSPGIVWALLTIITCLLLAIPWLPPAGRLPAAVVDLENCNGCERCARDCPFEAISMVPRSDGKPYASEAAVNLNSCVSCGICAGACPTATPFRTRSAMAPGIDLPDLPILALRDRLHEISEAVREAPRIITIACSRSPAAEQSYCMASQVLKVRCLAQLPPPFLDYASSRGLADGLILAGCTGGDCQYRLGMQWTAQRIKRERDPRLRQRVDNSRIAMSWSPPWADYDRPAGLHDAFRRFITSGSARSQATGRPTGLRRRFLQIASLAVTFTVFCVSIGWLSSHPDFRLLEADQAMIALSFSHAGERIHECRRLSQEDLNKLPPNMRAPVDCPRERHPVELEFRLDGRTLYRESLPPSGIWNDGESDVYKRLKVPAGEYRIFIGMRDSGGDTGFDYVIEETVVLQEQQGMLVEFDDNSRKFLLH